MPKQSPKKKIPAWLKWLAIIFGSIVFIVLVALLAVWLWFCNLRNTWTVTTRSPLPPVEVTKEDMTRLTTQYKKLRQAFAGKTLGETTVVFEGDDLDKLAAKVDEGQQLRDLVRMHLEDDKLIVKTDVNLDRYPLLKGRYLSGDFTWTGKMEGEDWTVHLESVVVKEKNMPPWILDLLNKKIAEKMDMVRSQFAPDWAKRIKSLTVKDGKMYVTVP